MKRITLYSDGSSLGNPGAGGYCGILSYKESEKIVKGGERESTNNRMELKAVIESLKTLKEPCEIDLYSDSIYVVKGIKEWLQNWIKKNFKNVKNPDLWMEYIEISKEHKVNANWVKAHADNEQNNRCDKIAKEEALKFKKE